jgi:hypothetical protein
LSSVMTRKETLGTSTFLPGEVAIAAGMDVGEVQVGCEGRKVGREVGDGSQHPDASGGDRPREQ